MSHSTIFRTFDSDIDIWTSKIGIFGKSFRDLSVTISNAFQKIGDTINHFDKNVGFWENLKNNLFNQNGKDFTRNSSGEIVSRENIDSYIKELDLSGAKDQLKEIFNWEDAGKPWDGFFDELKKKNQDYLIPLIKNTDDLSKLEGQDLVDACNAAREAVIAHNEALQNMSLKAKAGQIALEALSVAGNMLAGWLIGKGVELAIDWIDNLVHGTERIRERADEAKGSIDEINAAFAEQKETAEGLVGRYNELSKGVDLSNNKNVSLSTDEYEEFLSINEQLAEAFPILSTGIDENGRSILSLGANGTTAKEQLDELLKTEEELSNFKIAENIGDVFKGVLTYVEDAENASEELKGILDETDGQLGFFHDVLENGINLSKDNKLLFGGDITDSDKTEFAYAMQSAAQKFIDSLGEQRRLELQSMGIDGSSLFTMETNDATGKFDFYSNLYALTPDEISRLEGMISTDTESMSGKIIDIVSSKQQELQGTVLEAENRWADFLPDFISAIKSKGTFKNLAPDMQDVVAEIVGKLDYSYGQVMDDYDPNDWYTYVRDKLVVPISKLSEGDQRFLSGSFAKLFELDPEGISETNQKNIEAIIRDLSNLLKMNPADLQAMLGYDASDAKGNYDTALEAAKKKYGYDDKGIPLNWTDDGLRKFFDENIKTQDDIALWETVTAEIGNATDAMNAYTAAKEKNLEPNEQLNTPLTFDEAWLALDGADADSMKTLKKDLLELAQAGKLTAESFKETEGSGDFLAQLGLDGSKTAEIEDVISKINALASSADQLASMGKGISEVI